MTATARDRNGPVLLVFGGRPSPSAQMEPTCLAYSPATDDWFGRSAMRTSRGIGRAVTVRNQVYVIGGCATFGIGLRTVERYDPLADTWHTCAAAPELLHDHGAAAWRDSLIYVIGGGNWSPTSPPSARIWLFDPLTQTWDSATPLPEPLGAAAVEITGDTIIVACGWTNSGPSNRVWRGIIAAGMPEYIYWEGYESLPAAPRYRPACAVIDDRLFLCGGTLADHSVSNQTWKLDPLTRTWLPDSAMPRPLTDVFSAATLGPRLHVCGGFSGIAPYLEDHECLNTLLLEHDVGPHAVLSPVGRLFADSSYQVCVAVRNFTQSIEAVPVTVRITDSISGQLIFESAYTADLGPLATETLDFGIFTPGVQQYFLFQVFTGLTEDQDPTNDTMLGRCRTAAGSLPDGFGYIYLSTQEPDTIGFNWVEPLPGDTLTGWLPNSDDGIVRRDLMFSFPYYDTGFSRLYVGTDGTIQTSQTVTGANRPFPVYDFAHLIAPFWDDLNLREFGRVLERLDSTMAVYTWYNVPRYSSPADRLTFQAVLYADGRIGFNYLWMAGVTDSSTIGIQGHDGSARWFLEYVLNDTPAGHQPHDSTSIIFYPPFSGIAEPAPDLAPAGLTVSCPTIVSGRAIPLRLSPPGAGSTRLELLDVCGRVLASELLSLPGPRLDWQTPQLAPGMYFIRARSRLGTAAARFCLVR